MHQLLTVSLFSISIADDVKMTTTHLDRLDELDDIRHQNMNSRNESWQKCSRDYKGPATQLSNVQFLKFCFWWTSPLFEHTYFGSQLRKTFWNYHANCSNCSSKWATITFNRKSQECLSILSSISRRQGMRVERGQAQSQILHLMIVVIISSSPILYVRLQTLIDLWTYCSHCIPFYSSTSYQE